MVREELQAALGLQNRKSFRERYLAPALAGLIEMPLPTKPNSRFQEYRLTATGRKAHPPLFILTPFNQ